MTSVLVAILKKDGNFFQTAFICLKTWRWRLILSPGKATYELLTLLEYFGQVSCKCEELQGRKQVITVGRWLFTKCREVFQLIYELCNVCLETTIWITVSHDSRSDLSNDFSIKKCNCHDLATCNCSRLFAHWPTFKWLLRWSSVDYNILKWLIC